MSWVDWVLPGFIGAIIGFVTNDIAIRMLFRPLTQKKILGIPVPFTPGVIPRQRHKLAASLGRMTSTELLNTESVMVHLRRPSTVEAFSSTLSRLLDGFLERPLLFYLERLSQDGQGRNPLGKILVHTLPPLLGKLWDTPLEKIFPEGLRSALSKAASAIARQVTERSKGQVGLEWLENLLLDRFPAFYEALRDWLHTTEVRGAMNEAGLYLLRRALEQMSSVQRFLVSAVQYDKSLEASMPDLTESAVNRFLRFLDDAEHRRDLVHRAVSASLQGMDKTSFSEKIAPFFQGLWDDYQHQTLGATLTQFAGWGRGDWERWIGNALTGSGEMGAGFLEGLKERGWVKTPLAELLGIRHGQFESLAEEAAQSVLNLVEEQLPVFLKKFDIQAMVENRVNSLELERVEKLLLQVIERHLKWINVFGAILGAFLGVSQTLLRFFGVLG